MTAQPFDVATCRPRQREGLAATVLDDELVVYDASSSMLHHLNRTASLVWLQCDGERTVEAIARAVAGSSTTDSEAILQDVVALVEQLSTASLLVSEASTGEVVDNS
ncbi:MAG: PqqD family protein [Acidimicrobiia bacterium]